MVPYRLEKLRPKLFVICPKSPAPLPLPHPGTPRHTAPMAHLFLSHSSADDCFVRELRAALADLGQEVWIDSRQLRGGDPLES